MVPKYQKSLIQLMNSIKKKYQLNEDNDVLERLMPYLNKYKKIILILIDGMGYSNLKQLSLSSSFLYEHLFDVIQTVYPSTTVAATTTVCSGLPPVSTGWVGWYQYFKKYDNHYVMFFNKGYYDLSPAPKAIDQILSYSYIWDAFPVSSYIYAPFSCYGHKGYSDLEEMTEGLKDNLKKDEEQYHYFYYDGLDSKMHDYGISSQEVQAEFIYIEDALKKIYREIDNDTLMMVIADHGHIDIEGIYLNHYKDVMHCLKHAPSLEGRCMTFAVKEEQKDNFELLFNKYFGNDFRLFTHQEVFAYHLLGYGKEHKCIHDFIEDYLAVGITNKMFYTKKPNTMLGNHAGMTKEELEIPLLLFYK